MRGLSFIRAAACVALLAACLAGPAHAGGYITRASALTTTVVVIKAQPGTLGFIQCLNPNASTSEYVQVFDTISAVTLGTTVPKASFGFAGGQSTTVYPDGNFAKGIKIAATTTAAGSTAPATALDCNVGFY